MTESHASPANAVNPDADQPERYLDDNVWYTARATGLTMGPTGTDKDQIIIEMEIDRGDGGPWIRKDKFNGISTEPGLEITMGDVLKVGCKGFRIVDWVVDPKILVSVILKSREFEGKWYQYIDKIVSKRAEYTREIKLVKSDQFEEAFKRAHQKNLEYQQDKALKQSQGGGTSGGRSTSLPADPGDAAGRADFGREPEGNTQPFGGGQAPANGGRRARF